MLPNPFHSPERRCGRSKATRGLLCAEALYAVHIILPTSSFERPGNRCSEGLSSPRLQRWPSKTSARLFQSSPCSHPPQRVDAEFQIRRKRPRQSHPSRPKSRALQRHGGSANSQSQTHPHSFPPRAAGRLCTQGRGRRG